MKLVLDCVCFHCDFCSTSEQIFYLIQFAGHLFVFIGKQDSLPLVLLLVLGLKLLPLALTGEKKKKTKRRTRIVKLVTLCKFRFIPEP